MTIALALFATFWLATQTAHAPSALRFDDVTAAVGLDFVHVRGTTPDRHLPETMGSGVAWLDYDRDGDHDLYLVQGGPLPGREEPRLGNALYRNDDGRLRAVSGGAGHTGYGMGAAVADWDGDGFVDLFVTNFGPDVLLHNNGDGTFSELAGTGVEDGRWSSSAAWSDLDADGLPDLYVTRYLAYDPSTAPVCGDQLDERSYCHVDLFSAAGDGVYRNAGDGTFTDLSASAGVVNTVVGKGLGVVIGDVNGDDLPDVYVANDTQQNFLYVNRGDWTFEEQGLFSGTGYSESGTGQAGMGTEMRDLDGDGADEILVTNFAFENNNLYRQAAPGAYLDDSAALGFAAPGFVALSFGIVALDADADGDADIVVANGHILDDVDEVQDNTAYPQRNHLYENRLTTQRQSALAAGAAPGPDWRPAADLFAEVSDGAGSGFAAAAVSRGLAVGDLDGDGLPDLAVANSGGPARLLGNRSAAGRRLVLRLRGRHGNRDALGARVTVVPRGGDPGRDGAAGFPQVVTLRSGSSYLSQSAAEVYLGLGESSSAEVTVRWPGGAEQTFTVQADRLVLLHEGRDPLTRPLAAAR